MSYWEMCGISLLAFAGLLSLSWLYRRLIASLVIKRTRRWFRQRHHVWQGSLLILLGTATLVLGLADLIVKLPFQLVEYCEKSLKHKEGEKT